MTENFSSGALRVRLSVGEVAGCALTRKSIVYFLPAHYTDGMTSPYKKLAAALFLVFGLTASSLLANIEITLKNEFIEKYKDRVTIDANFTVDKALARPHAAKDDAELHVAGRAPEVKLPIVAEIMNAASQQPAMQVIHDAEGSNQAVPLNGVWRLWCEHGGESKQVQGEAVSPINTTNPPHVFEIHPILSLNNVSLLESVHLIEGYEPKDAETAFTIYEGLQSHINIKSQKQTTVTTSMAGYNFVEFVLKPLETPHQLADGTAVLADIYNLKGELLVHRRRMVFIKDSPPERALASLQTGQTMHVLGQPRISLKLLSYRRAHYAEYDRMLDWGLPYEIVVFGIYPNSPPAID